MSSFERVVRRGDKATFPKVTVQNQVAQTDGNGDNLLDEHGNIKWDTPTTIEVPAEIITRGTPTFQQHVAGLKQDVDAVAWISDPSVTVTSGRDAPGIKATRIIDGDKTYHVFEAYDEHNGRLRAHVQLEEHATS